MAYMRHDIAGSFLLGLDLLFSQWVLALETGLSLQGIVAFRFF